MRYAKFIIISLLILAAAYLGISGHPENTDAAETSLISYTYHEDGHAEVVSCDRNATGVLEIPSSVTVNGVTYSVTKILNNTFYRCTGLTSIEIPASVTVIEANAFDVCSSLGSFVVSADNTVYSSDDGVQFNKDKVCLVAFPAGRSGSYDIPGTVTSVESYLTSNTKSALHS